MGVQAQCEEKTTIEELQMDYEKRSVFLAGEAVHLTRLSIKFWHFYRKTPERF